MNDTSKKVVNVFDAMEARAGLPSLEQAVVDAEKSGNPDWIEDAEAALMLAKMQLERESPEYKRHEAIESGKRLNEWVESTLRAAKEAEDKELEK